MKIKKAAQVLSACAVFILAAAAVSDNNIIAEKLGIKTGNFSAAEFLSSFTEEMEGKKEAQYAAREFGGLSDSLKERISSVKGDREKLKAISDFIYGEAGFKFDEEANSAAARRAINSFYRESGNYESWPQLLSRRRGICAGLSALYMALAEEAGIMLFPVFAPGHVYLRYEKNGERINIETTLEGSFVEEAYYQKRAPENGLNCYLETMERPAIAAALCSNAGFHFDSLGKRREALALYKISVKLVPRLPEARANLAAAYLKAGMADEAESEAKEALRLYPGYPGALANLGAVYQKKGRHAAAERIYEAIIRKEPNSSQAFDGLGISARESGDLKKARACFSRAVELDPKNEKAVNNLGNVCMLQGFFDEAVEAYKRSILINPNRHESRMNLAAAYYSAGRFSASASEYERAVLLNPEAYYLYCNMGAAYQRLGRNRDAEKAFKQALIIKPDDSLSLFNMGALYLEMDKPEEALLFFEKAVKTDPENKEAVYNIGAAYEALGDPDKAEYYKDKSGLK